MPDQHITLTDEEYELLDRVRQQQGLDTVDQAAEWLVKTRLRRQTRNISGRGRALYLVKEKKPS